MLIVEGAELNLWKNVEIYKYILYNESKQLFLYNKNTKEKLITQILLIRGSNRGEIK